MKKLIALCFMLALSLSAFAQSDRQAPPQDKGEELIVLDRDDLEQSLSRLSEALRAQQVEPKQQETNLLRLQLLLHLLQGRQQQTPGVIVNHLGQRVKPQQPSQDYQAQLERIETMLLILLNKQGHNTAQPQPTIINKKAQKGAPKNDLDRVALLEEQLASLLARKAEPSVDTLYQVDTIRIVEAQAGRLVEPKVIVKRDTLYQDVSTVEVADFKRSIYFALGKSNLDVRAQETLREVAHFLRRYPQAKVGILGYASPDGNPQRNRVLAERRMQAALQFLQSAGLSNQIETMVGGVDKKASHYQLARRVDITLLR